MTRFAPRWWALVVIVALLAGIFGLTAQAARETPLYQPQPPLHDGSEREFGAYIGRGPDRVHLIFCMHWTDQAPATQWYVHITTVTAAPEPLPPPPRTDR